MELVSRFWMRPHLYKRPHPLVSRLVRQSGGWSVIFLDVLDVMLLSKSVKNGFLRILKSK